MFACREGNKWREYEKTINYNIKDKINIRSNDHKAIIKNKRWMRIKKWWEWQKWASPCVMLQLSSGQWIRLPYGWAHMLTRVIFVDLREDMSGDRCGPTRSRAPRGCFSHLLIYLLQHKQLLILHTGNTRHATETFGHRGSNVTAAVPQVATGGDWKQGWARSLCPVLRIMSVYLSGLCVSSYVWL